MERALEASTPHLLAQNIQLNYRAAGEAQAQVVLDIEKLEIGRGRRIGITGPSGAGKTSLLHVLTGIARPETGSINWDEVEVSALSEGARDRWRRENVGFVFQEFHLIPGMTVLQNVLLPFTFSHFRLGCEVVRSVHEILQHVAAPPATRLVETLSRGEQQRVALARAVANSPRVLIADEPTASLDAENSARTTRLLVEVATERNLTLIVVSHERSLLAAMDQCLWLEGGKLREHVVPPA